MKKNKPLVTISITCKNYGKFLKKSLESVLNQTYKKIEIYVVDDNSEDQSKKILDSLKKKYPKINWDRHSTRNTNISYFNETINFLAKKKIKVILIGSGSPKNLENKNSNLINYENSKFKSEFMDIYLFSKKKCKFEEYLCRSGGMVDARVSKTRLVAR